MGNKQAEIWSKAVFSHNYPKQAANGFSVFFSLLEVTGNSALLSIVLRVVFVAPVCLTMHKKHSQANCCVSFNQSRWHRSTLKHFDFKLFGFTLLLLVVTKVREIPHFRLQLMLSHLVQSNK